MNYGIAPKGSIKGGSASYEVDSTGLITYQVSVVVGWFLFSKTLTKSGFYQVDPSQLDPGNMFPGVKFKYGKLNVTVIGKDPLGQIDASLTIDDTTLVGTALLKPTKPVILLAAEAIGSIQGHDLDISIYSTTDARRETSFLSKLKRWGKKR